MLEAVLLMLIESVFIMPIVFIKLLSGKPDPTNTILLSVSASLIGYSCFYRIVLLQTNITMLIVILTVTIVAELYSYYLWDTEKGLRNIITSLIITLITFWLAVGTAIALIFLSIKPIC